MPHDQADRPETRSAESQASALWVLVALLLVGAAWLLAGLLVPLILAVILAIALSPLAARLERLGLGSTWANLLCLLLVAAVLSIASILILVQAGTMLQNATQYFSRFSQLLTVAARKTGSDRILDTFQQSGSGPSEGAGPQTPKGQRGEERTNQPNRQGAGASPEQGGQDGDAEAWNRLLLRSAQGVGRWVVSGLGGLLGVVGGVVICLAYLFYLLQTRGEWMDRISKSLARLGLRPSPGQLAKAQGEVVIFLGCLSLVSVGYSIVVSLGLWAIGVPQPVLWGILAGLLEFIPYFGPLIASILPTIVALSLGTWWQPIAVAAQYLGLHLVEGYIVTPLVYSKVIRFNPVTILFGALFFGWIWGPVGLALAVPMMILLRGLLVITPDTPSLDALAGVDDEKEHAGVAPER